MELRTILNRVYKLPGFVYGWIPLIEGEIFKVFGSAEARGIVWHPWECSA